MLELVQASNCSCGCGQETYNPIYILQTKKESRVCLLFLGKGRRPETQTSSGSQPRPIVSDGSQRKTHLNAAKETEMVAINYHITTDRNREDVRCFSSFLVETEGVSSKDIETRRTAFAHGIRQTRKVAPNERCRCLDIGGESDPPSPPIFIHWVAQDTERKAIICGAPPINRKRRGGVLGRGQGLRAHCGEKTQPV